MRAMGSVTPGWLAGRLAETIISDATPVVVVIAVTAVLSLGATIAITVVITVNIS